MDIGVLFAYLVRYSVVEVLRSTWKRFIQPETVTLGTIRKHLPPDHHPASFSHLVLGDFLTQKSELLLLCPVYFE